jgi:hypothetical protein
MVEATPGGQRVSYEWLDGGKWLGFSAVTTEPPQALVNGSPEEFILEHYWG